MQSHRGVGWVGLLVGLLWIAPAAADTAPQPKPAERSRPRGTYNYKEDPAYKAFAEKRYADAEALLRERMAEESEVGKTCNLGRVLLALGKREEAAQRLSYCLEVARAEFTPEEIRVLEEKIADASRDLGSMRVYVDVDRAEIFVDGEWRGWSPLEGALFVTPGSHVVEARLPSSLAVRREVEVRKGVSVPVLLTLSPSSAPPVTSADGAPKAPPTGALGAPVDDAPNVSPKGPLAPVDGSPKAALTPPRVAPLDTSPPVWPVVASMSLVTAGSLIALGGFTVSLNYGDVAREIDRGLGDDSACLRNFSSACSAHMQALVHEENAWRVGVAGIVVASVGFTGALLSIVMPPIVGAVSSSPVRASAGAAPGGGFVLLSGAF